MPVTRATLKHFGKVIERVTGKGSLLHIHSECNSSFRISTMEKMQFSSKTWNDSVTLYFLQNNLFFSPFNLSPIIQVKEVMIGNLTERGGVVQNH